MIELININKDNRLNNVNVKLPNTGLVFITGENGAGKTTLLNAIGQIDDYQGTIKYNDYVVKNNRKMGLDYFRRENIGYIYQDFKLILEKTVLENIMYTFLLRGEKADKNKVVEVLKKVGLYKKINCPVRLLSGGEQQRCAIARTIIFAPKILLADEPTGNLDPQSANEIMGLLEELSEENLVIIVCHDQSIITKYQAGILEMDKGRIVSYKEANKSKEREYSYKNKRARVKIELDIKKCILLMIFSLVMSFSVFLYKSYNNIDDYKIHSKQAHNEILIIDERYSGQLNAKEFDTIDAANIMKKYGINNIKYSNNLNIKIKYADYDNVTKLLDITSYSVVPFLQEEIILGNEPKGMFEVIIDKNLADEIIKEYKNVYKDISYEHLIGMEIFVEDCTISFKMVGMCDTNAWGMYFREDVYDIIQNKNCKDYLEAITLDTGIRVARLGSIEIGEIESKTGLRPSYEKVYVSEELYDFFKENYNVVGTFKTPEKMVIVENEEDYKEFLRLNYPSNLSENIILNQEGKDIKLVSGRMPTAIKEIIVPMYFKEVENYFGIITFSQEYTVVGYYEDYMDDTALFEFFEIDYVAYGTKETVIYSNTKSCYSFIADDPEQTIAKMKADGIDAMYAYEYEEKKLIDENYEINIATIISTVIEVVVLFVITMFLERLRFKKEIEQIGFDRILGRTKKEVFISKICSDFIMLTLFLFLPTLIVDFILNSVFDVNAFAYNISLVGITYVFIIGLMIVPLSMWLKSTPIKMVKKEK